MSKPACKFGDCCKPARSLGWCAGHYAQHLRKVPLSPLRGRHGQREAEPLVRMRGLRVSPGCAAAVEQDPPGAREALERWAGRRTREGER